MEYIRYQEAEKLFIKWPLIETIIGCSLLDLKAAEATSSESSEYIYNLTIGNKIIGGIIPSNNLSNPTETVALNYQKVINRDQVTTITEIEKDILTLWLVDEKMKLAYKTLSCLQKLILEEFYWHNKTWAEVIDELKVKKQYCSKRQAQDQRKYGLDKISRISKITLDVYMQAMKIIEGGHWSE